MEQKKIYLCSRCSVPLKKGKTRFSYLGKDFSHDTLKCPECGIVYISEETVRDRMKKAEEMLEGK